MDNTKNTPIDLLQIKIDQAKKELSEETLQSIGAVDWKNIILGMRQKKGYSFEQIESLELETELLLSGLVSPDIYQKELESRMGISKTDVNQLVGELNDSIFKKIREEFIKITEGKKTTESTGEIKESIPFEKIPPVSIPAQKLSAPYNAPVKKTEYTLNNLSKMDPEVPVKKPFGQSVPNRAVPTPPQPNTDKPLKADPYRELPE